MIIVYRQNGLTAFNYILFYPFSMRSSFPFISQTWVFCAITLSSNTFLRVDYFVTLKESICCFEVVDWNTPVRYLRSLLLHILVVFFDSHSSPSYILIRCHHHNHQRITSNSVMMTSLGTKPGFSRSIGNEITRNSLYLALCFVT